jgi:hypothetical protein
VRSRKDCDWLMTVEGFELLLGVDCCRMSVGGVACMKRVDKKARMS